MTEKKIALIVQSLSKGGMERSNAILSKILTEIGYETTIISVFNTIDFEYGGKFISLETSANIEKKVIRRKWSKLLKAKKIFNEHNFDIIIDSRTRPSFLKEFFIQKLLYKKTPTIYVVHSYSLAEFFNTRIGSIFLYRKKQLITVSNGITKNIKSTFNLKKVNTIYNSFEIALPTTNQLPFLFEKKYILFYGRIDNRSKNLFFLLDAFKKSILPQKKIDLVILGEGPDLKNLKNYAAKNNLTQHIIFKPFTKSPFNFVKNALFTVMTSHYEGFPMTLIESMSLATPVVSLNFKSGPSEIIKTGENGILVCSKSTTDFSKALDRMIIDKSFYKKCKLGAPKSVHKFKKEYISPKWIEIIENA